MAVGGTPITNTYDTAAAIGQREDLTDIFTRIDPAEVPFYTNTPKATQKGTLHEWQVQELDAVDKTAQPEGFETAFDAAVPSVRMGNRAQILARSYIVSGTLDVVDKAGRDRETVLQRTLKGLELRRDVEGKLLDNVASDGTDPRVLGGLMTWITTGYWGATTGAAPTGDGTDVATIGTPGALTFALLDEVMEKTYNAGGNPTQLLMTPNAKRALSDLDGSGLPALSRFNKNEIADTAFIGSVGVYLSDFGRLDTMVDRFAPGHSALGGAFEGAASAAAETIYVIDKRHVQIATLPGRSFLNEPLAKTGDADKAHMLWEGTLRVSGPKSHGVLVIATTADTA